MYILFFIVIALMLYVILKQDEAIKECCDKLEIEYPRKKINRKRGKK